MLKQCKAEGGKNRRAVNEAKSWLIFSSSHLAKVSTFLNVEQELSIWSSLLLDFNANTLRSWEGATYTLNETLTGTKKGLLLGCRHSLVDSSAPTILLPWVRVPSTPSTLLSFLVFVVYLPCENNENKQKDVGFGQFLKRKAY